MPKDQTLLRAGSASALLALALLESACALPGLLRGDARDGYPHAQAQQSRMRAADAGERRAAVQDYAETLERGDRLRDGGDPSGAIFHYLKALQVEPERNEPRIRIGFLHLRDNPSRAQGVFEDLVARDPHSGDAQLGLGLSLVAQSELAPARAALQRALGLGVRTPALYSALGMVFDREGNFEVAKGYYRDALELAPGNWELQNNLGTSQMLAGDYAAASESFRAALRRHEEPALWNNLGLALGRLGRYPEAEAAFLAAGSPAAAHNNLGLVRAARGDFEGALRHYEQALLLGHPDRLVVIENLRTVQALTALPARVRPAQSRVAPAGEEEPRNQSLAPWVGQSVDPTLWAQ